MTLFLFIVGIPAALLAMTALWGFAGCGAFRIDAGTVSSLQAIATDDNSITLSWDGGEGASFKRVKLALTSSSGSAQVQVSGSSGFVDGELDEGTTYDYEEVVDQTGDGEAPVPSRRYTTTLPTAPADVRAVRTGGKIALTWVPVSKSTRYIIQVQAGTGLFQGDQVVDVTAFPKLVDPPAPDGSLQYQVMSVVDGYNNKTPGFSVPKEVIKSVPAPAVERV